MRRRRGLVILRQVRLAAVAVVVRWAVGYFEVFSELELHVTSCLLVEKLGVNREIFLTVVLCFQTKAAPVLLLDLVGEVLVAPDAEVLVVPMLMVHRGGQGARGHRGQRAGLLLGAPGRSATAAAE